MVLMVGDFSTEGQIKKMLSNEDQEQTPLQQKVEKVAKQIGVLGLVSAILIVVVLIARHVIERIAANNWNWLQDIEKILRFLLLGV